MNIELKWIVLESFAVWLFAIESLLYVSDEDGRRLKSEWLTINRYHPIGRRYLFRFGLVQSDQLMKASYFLVV